MPQKIIVCPKCKEQLSFTVDDSIIANSKSFPIPSVVQHKDHFLIVYLDSHSAICDVEIPLFFKSE
ncbi:MAG: hypothetical protein HWN67_09710 [Candidatus Helarchaeota archaeon]|nr:hypothetical protein [Candidatus Helarchaeota archaeon]